VRDSRRPRTLEFFPLSSAYSGLLQEPGEKIPSDVALMWVWQANGGIALDHELVFPTGVRPIKAESTEVANQLTPPDRTKSRHYPAF
jgi:hypothetical protein